MGAAVDGFQGLDSGFEEECGKSSCFGRLAGRWNWPGYSMDEPISGGDQAGCVAAWRGPLWGGTMTVGGMRHYITYRAMLTADQQHA